MFPLYSDHKLTRIPFATILFMVLNVGMFIYQGISPEAVQAAVWRFGLIPYEVFHPSAMLFEQRPAVPLTFITGMFSHGGIIHLLSNMLYLWVFGRDVEDDFGFLRFSAFYLGTGLLSSVAFVLMFPTVRIPLVGASGAIAGLMGAYFLRFPSRKIYTLFFLIIFIRVIPLPAFVMLGYWFVIQFASCVAECTAGAAGSGGVAWIAHIAGFVAGIVWTILILRGRYLKRRAHSYET